MKNTPLLDRLNVSIFGKCNSGKSSLFNAISRTTTAIVSDIAGTTTDPVIKAMELLPHGAIILIDTAGSMDNSKLGDARIKKTNEILNRTDFAIYASTALDFDEQDYNFFEKQFKKRNIPHIIVFTKKDLYENHNIKKYANSIDVSIYDSSSINRLCNILSNKLDEIKSDELPLLHGLTDKLQTIVCVIPIDESAPKKRLILPQVQLIRECLDNDIRCNITTVNTLEDALKDSAEIDLIVTDSQVFKDIADITFGILLTSFSVLLARQKGNIKQFLNGIKALENLSDNDKVLIAESCTHTTNHEDIGQIKIPNLIRSLTKKNIHFEFSSGRDYKNLSEFSLIVHCGGCMISKKEFTNRLVMAKDAQVPITNYGMLLAYGSGILERAIEVFVDDEVKAF